MAFLILGENGDKNSFLGRQPAHTAAQLAYVEKQVMNPELRERAVALHDQHAVSSLVSRVLRSFRLPTEELAAYFGPRAGAYFAFMDTYTRSLVLPTAAFMAMKLLRPRATPARVAAFRVACRVAIAAWALRLVNVLRSRRQISDNLPSALLDQKALLTRKDNGVGATGRDPRRQRFEKMSAGRTPGFVDKIVSAASTSAMLVGVGTWIIFSMNAQGYILNSKSRFAVHAVQRMTHPGGALDMNHAVKGLIAPIVHSQVMASLNVRYSRAVEKLSIRDGTGHHGVIAKRLCFEMMDNFMPITWIALVRRDAAALSTEVLSTYQTDEVRRMVTETVIPYALHAFQRRGKAPSVEEAADLDEWEDFDEWLEMLTQLAYLVFLGADSPIVFPLSLFSNYLEQRSDLFKVSFTCRRPLPESKENVREDMGTWMGALTACVYAGVALNGFQVVNILTKTHQHSTHSLMK